MMRRMVGARDITRTGGKPAMSHTWACKAHNPAMRKLGKRCWWRGASNPRTHIELNNQHKLDRPSDPIKLDTRDGIT